MNRTMAPRQHISDVATEAGYSSVATTTETIIDTRSEPPGLRPRDAARLMNRAEALEGVVRTTNTNNTNGAAIIATSISPDPPVDDNVLVGGGGGSNKVRSLPAQPMTKLEAKLSRAYDGSSSKRPTQHQQQGEDKEGEGGVKSSTTSKSSTHRVAAKNYPSSQTLKSQQYSSQSYTKN